MISGTNVAEIITSLPDGEIVRIVGSGWHPRSYKFELISKDKIVEISNYASMVILIDLIKDFIKLDKEKDLP